MATPLKRIRVDDNLWDRFGDTAAALGSDRTKVLVAFMRSFVTAMSPERLIRSMDADHAHGLPPSAP